ncbi:Cephalosporin-C deacetylase [Paenibacillus curdlanolyticus YK9]|uniref:Cephalosporin-C deacetylase n=1 Tax=Paenibacillus curdlanolyticus YK9 TaxID=717606 RepID=E0IBF1_9BACL|nr:Cephalosporin-C deacetylase [Paenibacillus curdlanolyticus YK9]
MANDKVEDLLKYMGSSPRPDNFDTYWIRALKELDSQSLEYELVPAKFQTSVAECYHLYFTGVGGARIHAKYVKPIQSTGKGPGVALFHGYHSNSGDWFDKVAFASHGITVLAMDCRGQSGLSEDNLCVRGTTLKGHIIRGIDEEDPDRLYYRNVFLDLVQTVRILQSLEQVDPSRIGVHGCSQGGALTLACAALEPTVKLAISVYPFLSDYKKAWEMEAVSSAYEEIAYYFRFMDPVHSRQDDVFDKLGYIDIQNLADRIQAKVIFVTALADSICPPYTQFAAYNKIQSEKELVVYHEYGHEYLPDLSDRVLQAFLKL